MADAAEQTDVKEELDPSTISTPGPEGTPPAEENSAPGPEGRVPHSRFNEVIHERNRANERIAEYEAKIRELELRQSGQGAKSNLERVTARLRDELKMDESAARKLAEIQLETAESIAKAQTDELRKRNHRQEVESWSRGLSDKYGDYSTVAPAMEKLFNQLPPETQDLVVSSSAGLEMLYSHAKNQLSDPKSAFDKGTKQAYDNKGLKKAISSAPGMGSAGGKSPLSREVIAKMPNSEYKERKAEIDAWVVAQSRKP